MSDDEAYAVYRAARFADNGGEPFCVLCGHLGVYEYKSRRIFKCKECGRQFSVTSGDKFHASRKMSFRDILLAYVIFVNGVNGHAALHLSRELKCAYKTAFVLAHKLREAIGTLQKPGKLTGFVEIDGVLVGGHQKKANYKKNRKDMRASNPKRQTIVNLRERRRGGRIISFVCRSEADAIPVILARVDKSAKIRTDEGTSWGILHAHYTDVKQVNHKVAYYENGIHTNWVESFHSRIRRAERGVHCRISGKYLQGYADELAWREDHRRVANGTQFAMLLGATARQRASGKWKGYWQRRKEAGSPANDNE